MDRISKVEAVSKEILPQWITIKSLKDDTYQTFKAEDLEQWINGKKLDYKYFTYRSNNPYLYFSSKLGVTVSQDKVYLTDDLPKKEKLTKEYYEGIKEGDTITVFYSNDWWSNTLDWDKVKSKLKK